jgi:hypothetical protein
MSAFRSLAVVAALALPLSSAHATTYTFTPTLVDLNTTGNVTGTFGSGSGSYSFNDPSTFFYVDTLNITANGASDDDELALDFAFTAPGTGTASITGDAEITGRRDLNGDIDWDSAFDIITLSNGSVVDISLPNFLGSPYNTSLSSCSRDDRGCTCPSGDVCGTTDVTISVLANDPPAATPEPSSLALLGTGVLGAAGFVRRRITA